MWSLHLATLLTYFLVLLTYPGSLSANEAIRNSQVNRVEWGNTSKSFFQAHIKASMFPSSGNIGICTNEWHEFVDATGSDDLLVHLPKASCAIVVVPFDAKSYMIQEDPYTSTDPGLGDGKTKGRLKAKEWMQRGSNVNFLPANHPRMNRSNCIRLSALTGSKPIKIYADWKQTLEPFYGYVLSNALVHPTGIVSNGIGLILPKSIQILIRIHIGYI
jgi:hypothetical protein